MRLGTWNLEKRWTDAHRRLMEDAACDVWLLTEVPLAFSLEAGEPVRSDPMDGRSGSAWAALWGGEGLDPLPAPHEAAALARRGDLVLCSCVLPWRGAGPYWPDPGPGVTAMTTRALSRLQVPLGHAGGELVWGGDWNHAMRGREAVGSRGGREAIGALVERLGLRVATADAPHRVAGLSSIDHIAVPKCWQVTGCTRIVAEVGGRRLSDHDAYIADVQGPAGAGA